MAFSDLQYFLAIAKTGSLTRAGAQLGVQKGALSKALTRLEKQLGVKLFERSTRRLAITRAGGTLQIRAKSLVSELEALRDELRRDEREVSGTLTIVAPPELGVLLTRGLFTSYLAEHPRTRLRLKLDYGYQDLFDPEIDAALRIGEGRDDSLVARPLWTFRRVLVASAAFARRYTLKTLSDLAATPCLGFDERSFAWSWAVQDEKGVRELQVSGGFVARSYPALLAAACAGVGVAFLPEFVVAPLLEQRKLTRVLSRFASEQLRVSLLFRPGQRGVRRISSFTERLSQASELPPGLHRIARHEQELQGRTH